MDHVASLLLIKTDIHNSNSETNMFWDLLTWKEMMEFEVVSLLTSALAPPD